MTQGPPITLPVVILLAAVVVPAYFGFKRGRKKN